MEGAAGDVPSRHHFIVKNGTRIKNLRELYSSLQSMDDITFNHHVNDFKNDFHNWVRDIHKDNELASELLAAKTKEEMAETLKRRIEELGNIRKEVKKAEAKSEKVEKQPAKKRRKPKPAKKTANAQTKKVQPKEEDVSPEAVIPTAPKIEISPSHKLRLTAGDFMLGLLIGAIAGLIIARFV